MKNNKALELLNRIEVDEVNCDGDGVNGIIVKDSQEHIRILLELGATDGDLANMRQGFEKEGIMDILELATRFANGYEKGLFTFKENLEWVSEREKEIFRTDHLKAIGKENDFLFQALVFLGDASRSLSLATTVMAREKRVPIEQKKELKEFQQNLRDYQVKINENYSTP